MGISRTSVLFVLLFATMLPSLGCSKLASILVRKATEKAVEGATGSKEVKLEEDGTIKVKGPDGEQVEVSGTGLSTKLPSNWPSYIPLYPGSTIASAVSFPKGANLVPETPDGVEKVHAYYNLRVEGAGFAKEVDMGTPEGKVVHFKRGKETVSLTIGKGGESDRRKTSYTISIASE